MSAEDPGRPAYEPPTIRVLGNVHELLAQVKSLDCDMEDPARGPLISCD